MPRKKQDPSTKPMSMKNQKGDKKCNYCHEIKKVTDFYISENPIHSADKRVPICKDCIVNASLNENGTINELEFNKILKLIDRPYYKDMLEAAVNGFKESNQFIDDDKIQYYGKEIIQNYFRLIAMPQDRKKNYFDSEQDGFVHKNPYTPKSTKERIANKYADIKNDAIDKTKARDKKFKVTQAMIDMFGEDYTDLEYEKMVKKYNDMTKTYVVQTNLHKEALLTYVRFKVKEEMATSKGDVQEAQRWYSAAQDAAEKAKLTPRQLSKEDLQGGIVNFSDIFTAVEGAKERIQIFPEFKYQPKDAADFIIWCYINYERNLNNMPEVKYKDIYQFYDEKKQEYIEMYGDPYGIFTDDMTESNRETIEKFITIPKEFADGES